jgi:hypothetical protein
MLFFICAALGQIEVSGHVIFRKWGGADALYLLLTFEAYRMMMYVCCVFFCMHSANVRWFFNVTEM